MTTMNVRSIKIAVRFIIRFYLTTQLDFYYSTKSKRKIRIKRNGFSSFFLAGVSLYTNIKTKQKKKQQQHQRTTKVQGKEKFVQTSCEVHKICLVF